MELTPEIKAIIDAKTHYDLLYVWRFAPLDTCPEILQGESGTYWGQRMGALRDADPSQAVRNSKRMGW